MRSIVTGLLFTALLPAVVAAQTVSDLTTGQRLRVSLEKRLTGTLVSIDSSSLTLDAGPPSGQVRYPLDQVRRVEVSKGRRSRFVKAGLGLLAGAALGALVGAAEKEDWVYSESDYTAMGAITGAAAGFLVGLVLPPGEKWEPVSIPESERSLSSMGVIPGSPSGEQSPSLNAVSVFSASRRATAR